MKVICKSTNDYSDDKFWMGSLKVGKEYEVVQQIDDTHIGYLEYMVKNDYGFEHIYPAKLFITKKELRERKLNKLGICTVD